MSVTSGFFNSVNGDRRYNAEQMSAIFDGVINDGVFANVGNTFTVKAESGNKITVDSGRAWFNGKWLYNDAILPLTADVSEVVLDRIDAVVIEIDRNESARSGDIKIIKGTPASDPQRPTMSNSNDIYQYPLAYINRKASSTDITQADITNMVGTSDCPYITAILQVTDIDHVFIQWEAQWNKWYSEITGNANSEMSEWMALMKSDFDSWFASLQIKLDGDMAVKFANEIIELQNRFEILAKHRAVYESLEDFENELITDSDGFPIDGATIMSSDSGSSIAVKNLENNVNVLNQKMASFENTKSDLVGSALGQALGLTADSQWASVISELSEVDNEGVISWDKVNVSEELPAGYYEGITISSKASYAAGAGAGETSYVIRNSAVGKGQSISWTNTKKAGRVFVRYTVSSSGSNQRLAKVTVDGTALFSISNSGSGVVQAAMNVGSTITFSTENNASMTTCLAVLVFGV